MGTIEATARQGSAAPSAGDVRTVIAASSLGTLFEWYDFFIYGTLAASGIIGRIFFPPGNEQLQTLLAWAGFAVGFGFRPLGAVLFGYLGDKFGRKYTFIVTIVLMGVATAGVGLVPSYATIGWLAPALIILLRIIQGLALGGEYGGAAIYVAEHAPPGRRGLFTSFIQACVGAGFFLSLVVVLACKGSMSAALWDAWGWRVPFLLSLVLLAISLWMRVRLAESPVFQAMKAAGKVSKNPLVESFTYPGNGRRLVVALFGIAAGFTVIWFTAMFSTLGFLRNAMHVDETVAQIVVGGGAVMGLGWFILFGHLSDRFGRKRLIVIGYALTLALLFPLFWLMGSAANPGLTRAAERAPIVVAGPDCRFNPFAKVQQDACGRLLDYLSKRGIAYSLEEAPAVVLSIGGTPADHRSDADLDAKLKAAGYPLGKASPGLGGLAVIFLAIMALTALSGATYGPVAALLTELFPARIRYSSMSIPYHFGTGYFGGVLPFVEQYVVARTGDPYAGLWYSWGVVAMALVVTMLLLKERDLVKDDA
ncbi:MFS transporter [Sphingomonas sp. HITSZ_GF]|uniref:MFS transporter n=1 Tax=Sphingomonas sp. HITSZ_GF TaxID=3037247 RepID=UPI00240D54BC|nr:MFS transporter [Sphingomonas sp. HITSZ_GF]MDG2535900.1 MFS transporter [Sphingomonas sp. HITSZ_GF]